MTALGWKARAGAVEGPRELTFGAQSMKSRDDRSEFEVRGLLGWRELTLELAQMERTDGFAHGG